ncbi:MAG: hypothetical protein EXQ53_09325 [Acidobacteria bacterium]|nr:hypothetical protein [Acidobacteriota bacterium]
MTDTPPDVQARFDELMRQRTGSDRVRMMSDMFDFAKALVLSNLRNTHPGATDPELRILLFNRLYGDEIDPAQHRDVVACLRGERQPM